MANEYCNNKRKYDKKGAVSASNKRMREDRISLRIYPCPKCKGWHLTSKLVRKKWRY